MSPHVLLLAAGTIVAAGRQHSFLPPPKELAACGRYAAAGGGCWRQQNLPPTPPYGGGGLPQGECGSRRRLQYTAAEAALAGLWRTYYIDPRGQYNTQAATILGGTEGGGLIITPFGGDYRTAAALSAGRPSRIGGISRLRRLCRQRLCRHNATLSHCPPNIVLTPGVRTIWRRSMLSHCGGQPSAVPPGRPSEGAPLLRVAPLRGGGPINFVNRRHNQRLCRPPPRGGAAHGQR